MTDNDPVDEGSEKASAIGQEGLERHQLECGACKVADLGLYTPGPIQRSIARRQANGCDRPELTSGCSTSATSVELSSGTPSMVSSGVLPHVLSSETLLVHMGVIFDNIGEIEMPPPTVVQQFNLPLQAGSEIDLSILQSFSEYDMC